MFDADEPLPGPGPLLGSELVSDLRVELDDEGRAVFRFEVVGELPALHFFVVSVRREKGGEVLHESDELEDRFWRPSPGEMSKLPSVFYWEVRCFERVQREFLGMQGRESSLPQ